MNDEEIKIPPNAMQRFNDWCKKNMFTVIGIFIILCLVLYDYATIQNDKRELVNRCNDYWFKQVKTVCPILSTQGNAGFDYNLSLSKNIGIGDSND